MNRVELDPFTNVIYDHLAKQIQTVVACGHKGFQEDVRAIVNWMTYPDNVNNHFLQIVIEKAREKNRQYNKSDPDKPDPPPPRNSTVV